MKKDTVVLGFGNPLLSDEGVGIYIIKKLVEEQERYRGVDFIDAGTAGLSLIHYLEGRKKAVIIDCAVMGTEAGTIRRFEPQQVKSRKKLSHRSLHEADLLKIIETAQRLGQCAEKVVIFGIEPKDTGPGRGLSDVVAAKTSDYISLIEKELDE